MRSHYVMNPDGTFRVSASREDYPEMGDPQLCACGKVFDLWAVEVVQRYADCTVFKLPCCGRTTDDRPSGWKSGRNYERLER